MRKGRSKKKILISPVITLVLGRCYSAITPFCHFVSMELTGRMYADEPAAGSDHVLGIWAEEAGLGEPWWERLTP